MSNAARKPAEEINYWITYIDCALSHPQPLPKGRHVFRSDLSTVPELCDLYDCLYKLYSEESISGPFREPVNALTHGIFKYHETVREPMSLRTVLDRIAEGGHYSQASQVMQDVDTIWNNCVQFNGADSSLAADAKKCQAILARLQERHADEQQAPSEDVDRLVSQIEDAPTVLVNEIEEYFRKSDPALLLSSGDLDLACLKVKHVKAMNDIVERFLNRRM